MPQRKPINVAVSVLADISLGIYRTPANALKELVSNAFDADATQVVINTGYPFFQAMTCQDNGCGMLPQEFDEIMNKIGGSAKRKDDRQTTDRGRPIIGKIGIGILAVAQVCGKFTVISSARDHPGKFEATVDISGFATEKAKEISLGSEEAVEIGSYDMIANLPADADAHYTKIILEDIEPGFRERLLERSGPDSESGFRFKQGDPETITDFVDWLSGTSVREISDYNTLLWEMAVICPIPYLDKGPIRSHDIIPEIRESLIDYDFSVKVDGLELRKPVLFPSSPNVEKEDEEYKVYSVAFDDLVNDKRLAFQGYIFYQRTAIMPPELRGLLVRLRNVAIGMYDKSLLNYPQAQGPRIAMLSGEVFIMHGLEDALNVDRYSFRETDPHYLKLQEVIYRKLGRRHERGELGIFSDISKMSKRWNEERRANEEAKVREALIADIESQTKKKFEIKTSSADSSTPVDINMKTGEIVIFEQNSIFPRPRASRRLIERILITYELANQLAESKDESRKEFYRLLQGGEDGESVGKRKRTKTTSSGEKAG